MLEADNNGHVSGGWASETAWEISAGRGLYEKKTLSFVGRVKLGFH